MSMSIVCNPVKLSVNFRVAVDNDWLWWVAVSEANALSSQQRQALLPHSTGSLSFSIIQSILTRALR